MRDKARTVAALLTQHPFVRQHIDPRPPDGPPQWCDLPALLQALQSAEAGLLEEEESALAQRRLSCAAREAARARLDRQRRSFFAMKPRVVVGHIRFLHGSCSPVAAAGGLALNEHWASELAHRPPRRGLIAELLRRFPAEFPPIEANLSPAAFLEVIAHSPPTSPGPDGIPGAAYQCCARVAAIVFSASAEFLVTHGALYPDLNECDMVSIPKKWLPSDRSPVTRAPEELRPLCLANVDQKILTRGISAPLLRALPAFAPVEQRGGVSGRSIAANVIEVEAYGLIQAISAYGTTEQPTLLLTDFSQAFVELCPYFL